MAALLSFFSRLLLLFSVVAVSDAAASVCPSQLPLFLQCPLGTPALSFVEVDGAFLDRTLSFKIGNDYASVLFYASWCPFSRTALSTFQVLPSMFPQIMHLAVEESRTMPLIFSKYGIHSLPAIVIANRTARIRYYGSKDLNSIVRFYKRITGLQPVEQLMSSKPPGFENEGPLSPWYGSPKEILKREPYLLFSLMFVYLLGFFHIFEDLLSRIKSFWITHLWHPNLGFFGELSQLLLGVLHAIDLKNLWNKLSLCKNGAKNARVWASSLASVSLGESSTTRSAGQLES